MVTLKCRLWWPEHLSSRTLRCSIFLFGWSISSSDSSVDIVIADGIFTDNTYLSSLSNLEEFAVDTNRKLPIFLQSHTSLSVVGFCGSDQTNLKRKTAEENNGFLEVELFVETPLDINNQKLACGCQNLENVLELDRKLLIGNGNWIQLSSNSKKQYRRDIRWTPKLEHFIFNGQSSSQCDFHVIFYRQPMGGLHFSLNAQKQKESIFKKPQWIDEIEPRNPLPLLEIVLSAINSTNTVTTLLQIYQHRDASFGRSFTSSIFARVFWCLSSLSVASIATLYYTILQFWHQMLTFETQLPHVMIMRSIFKQTWKNLSIRSCQFLYWPIFLQGLNQILSFCIDPCCNDMHYGQASLLIFF